VHEPHEPPTHRGAEEERHQREQRQRDPLPAQEIAWSRPEQRLGEVFQHPAVRQRFEPSIDALYGAARKDPDVGTTALPPQNAHRLGLLAGDGDFPELVVVARQPVVAVARRVG
jgi:hypothetical protein